MARSYANAIALATENLVCRCYDTGQTLSPLAALSSFEDAFELVDNSLAPLRSLWQVGHTAVVRNAGIS